MGSIDKFFEWLFTPAIDILGINPVIEKDEFEDTTQNSNNIDTVNKLKDCITEDEVNTQNQYSFRPKNLNEYIGQRRAKIILANYIQGIKERKIVFPHTLIHGSPGMGKTTLANIVAKLLNVRMVETIASEIETADDMLQKIVLCEGGIVFLDEIHSLKRPVAEKFYPMMEQFQFEGNPLPPFTLIGATTEVGELLKDRKPLYDRFKLVLELEEYLTEDLIKIGRQYKKKVFPNDMLSRGVFETVANNSRGTPRTVIRLVEATIYFKHIKNVLESFRIIKDGYTYKDLKTLKYISNNEKGVGLQGLASFLNSPTESYLYEIEPFLLQKGLIIRTSRGRKITEEGIKKIIELEERIKEK